MMRPIPQLCFKRLRFHRGVTMIELMIAIFLTLIVALAAGVIFIANQRSWREGQGKLLLQTEATHVVEWIARDIRASRTLVLSGTSLTCYDGTGTQAASYGYDAGSDRVLRNGSPVSQENCLSLTFTPNVDTTTVKFEIEFEDDVANKIKVDSKATVRNVNRSSWTP